MLVQLQQVVQPHFQESGKVPSSSKIPLQQQLDRVKLLPGQPEVSFAQYAGYVTVNETAGRALFYYFVEATSSPETKPIVLWLTGGPGGSSLGYGAWEELGPFQVRSDGYTLYQNPYSWNRVANFIFLESPAGVGFSYSNNTQDYSDVGDTKTSYDSLIFLIKWFERFPQYKHRDFYILGESYGGHYVPQLSKRVHDFNKGQATTFMNFKGFLVINAVIDSAQDSRGVREYWWSHGLISDETFAQLKSCPPEFFDNYISGSCKDTLDKALGEQGDINPYDIYTPLCPRMESAKPHAHGKGQLLGGYDPCMQSYVHAYFNRPDVQEALHANVTQLDYEWKFANLPLNLNYFDRGDVAESVIPIFEELVNTSLKIWVISGDVDSVVPIISTRYSLQLLNLNTTVPWHAWYLDGEVGGYTQGYDGLTLVTVRDAGHEIPMYEPARALAVFKSYITGEGLPRS